MLKKILRVVFSKTFAFIILALIQIGFYVTLIYLFANTGAMAYYALTIITVIVLIVVLEQDELNPAYKLLWVLVIVMMPLTGALFYVLWGHRHVPHRTQRSMDEIEKRADDAMVQEEAVMEALRADDLRLQQSAHYLLGCGKAPVYASGGVEYYPIGQDFFPRFLEAIKNAEKFIFMEYYILEEGVMLDATVEILRQKAAQGVDVRMIWDGFGCLLTLPPGYIKKLRSYGIKCHPFSPLEFTIHVSDYAMLNHRDHRKITVVDGVVAFSGGLNFADEYINEKVRFGEWKDTAFMIKGEAAFGLTSSFLRMWDYVAQETTDLEAYRPPVTSPRPPSLEQGYVQPYWDSPLDAENVSENAYLNIIRHAVDYVYISTPYLILDHEMITSLALAAKSGVDVRILTPGIPDKPTVFLVTKSYYPILLKEGVRIYEYTPGFNHAKMYVSDDKVAIVGSANMDYRSLYLHFENCVCFYGGPIVGQAKQDMVSSFEKAHEITLEETRQMPLRHRLLQVVVKFFAPMM